MEPSRKDKDSNKVIAHFALDRLFGLREFGSVLQRRGEAAWRRQKGRLLDRQEIPRGSSSEIVVYGPQRDQPDDRRDAEGDDDRSYELPANDRSDLPNAEGRFLEIVDVMTTAVCESQWPDRIERWLLHARMNA